MRGGAGARRGAALAGLAALIALAAPACGGGDGRTTIRLWAMGREAEVVTALTAEFEREHPGLRVEVQQIPWLSAHEKLLTAVFGDATPDVAQLGNTWLPELVAIDALAPLDVEIASSPVVRADDYFEGIWATNELDGALYGVPWYVDTRLVFYRKDLLEAAGLPALPSTWRGWLEAMRAIKARAGDGRYAILLPLDEFDQLLALALSQPDPLLRDGGRWGNFQSPGFRRALAFYLQVFAEGLAPRVIQTQASNPWHELGSGYVAMMLHGPWSIGEMKRRLPASLQDAWTTAPLPGPTGPGTSTAGGSSLVVFRGSAHPREAWQLIEFLSRPEIQRRFQALTGNLPPRRAAWRDAAFASDEHVRAFRDQLERVRRAPPVPEWERIVTRMREVSERAARRVGPGTTPAELEAIVDAAVVELDRGVDELLAKRRWLLAKRAGRKAARGAL